MRTAFENATQQFHIFIPSMEPVTTETRGSTPRIDFVIKWVRYPMPPEESNCACRSPEYSGMHPCALFRVECENENHISAPLQFGCVYCNRFHQGIPGAYEWRDGDLLLQRIRSFFPDLNRHDHVDVAQQAGILVREANMEVRSFAFNELKIKLIPKTNYVYAGRLLKKNYVVIQCFC